MAENSGIKEDLRSVIGYFTILPVKNDTYPTVRGLYFLSSLGLVLGLVAGIIYYFVDTYVDIFSASITYVVFIIAISGFRELEAVLNIGDALLLRDNKSRMLKFMKDPAAGAGGLGTSIVIYGLTVAFVLSISPVYALIAIALAEGTSKLSFATSAFGRKMLGNGTGAGIIENISRGGLVSIYLNCAIPVLISLLLGIDFFLALLVGLLLSFVVTRRLETMLSGINGDVLGFSGEVARMTFIVAFAILSALTVHFGILNLIVHV